MANAKANGWDASIKLLYPTDEGTFFTLAALAAGEPYDVVANVEIGENLNEAVDEHILRVSIVNLTTATQVAFVEVQEDLKPENNTKRRAELRAKFPPIPNLTSGDVLQAVASYKVVAGVNFDLSTAQSETFAAE
ncbi:hypothetical protein SAMN05421812_108305 [Asanoa hainanensis]|uniref:Uncharacterized protein n=1 Tax=Asanoa hainanensis TaxID=560556 RepID=A0A239NI48_9ACTN|nr:hypothetical protein [Asanoa hainanensis]SNT53799.1 hypothetical protein SAMN05421812_108305 [Asanoa hainanensis]